MKLIRVGELDKEKPAIIDDKNNYRDLSSIIPDLNPDTLNFNTLEEIKKLNINNLPILDSKLRIGGTQTNPKCRINLQERPYLTVPFLGRGPSNPVLESKLMQGASVLDKKSCKTITEKQLVNRDDDLVPSLKSTIQNPANLVEGVAANGWIRGGLPSRELTRDMDYFKRK